MDLVLGSRLLGAPVGSLWIRDLVLSTGTVSAVVWLGWGVGICGVNISHSLEFICPIFLLCIPFQCYSAGIIPLYSIGLPRI